MFNTPGGGQDFPSGTQAVPRAYRMTENQKSSNCVPPQWPVIIFLQSSRPSKNQQQKLMHAAAAARQAERASSWWGVFPRQQRSVSQNVPLLHRKRHNLRHFADFICIMWPNGCSVGRQDLLYVTSLSEVHRDCYTFFYDIFIACPLVKIVLSYKESKTRF